MFKNYIKIAFRNIVKHKLHAGINILGLAFAIACCLLLVLFIRNELSYDSFHKNGDNIFRINSSLVRENTSLIQATTQAPLAPTLKKEIPEILFAARFLITSYTVEFQDNLFTERTTFTDPDFLKMFSFNLIQGNPDDVLRDRNTIVISEEVADKYFSATNPIGKQLTIIRYGVSHSFTINGIVESPPENSSIQYDILIPFQKLRDFLGDDYFSNWGLYSVRSFIQLSNSSQFEFISSKIPPLIKRYQQEGNTKYSLQPLPDIHFAATVQETMVPVSSMTYSYILAGISFLILLIASFNSMNISSALASMRYKEVGVRKVMGAARQQLIIQLSGETVILAFIAFILGILLAKLFLPTFNILAEKNLEFKYFENWYSFLWAILFILSIGLLSGLFPAVLLSKYPPAELYQRKQMIGGRSSFSRSSIMVQFGLSIFLIVCTLVMSNQLKYLKTRNLGFNQNQIVVIPYRSIHSQQILNTYRSELIKYGSIINISGAYSYPSGNYDNAKATSGNSSLSINHCKIDYDFLETFGIVLKEGRSFSRNIASDTTGAIIINEVVVNRMGWKSPIGKKMIIEWMGWEVEVVGVVENFHYASLHEKIEPLMFYLDPFVPIEYFFVKTKPEEISQTLELLKDKWKQIVPDQPFDYFFLDQRFAQFYHSEERWNRIVTYASIIAIFITCFGLFGLSALLMTKRTKEIGIRKVVGASVKGIVLLLSSEFTKWILLANIIAWPTAYYAMDLWLQNFAYKIEISWWTFVLAGCIGLIIALVVISFQAIKTAMINPVESLRYE